MLSTMSPRVRCVDFHNKAEVDGFDSVRNAIDVSIAGKHVVCVSGRFHLAKEA